MPSRERIPCALASRQLARPTSSSSPNSAIPEAKSTQRNSRKTLPASRSALALRESSRRRPDRIGALRGIVGARLILAPGVGAQGGKASDAIAAGADAVIVGRTIYEAKDPAAAARG